MNPYQEVDVNLFAMKARSKREVYQLLTVEGGIYLPPLPDANHKYISAILVGNKKYLHSKDVKVCSVPQIEGLSVKDVLEYAQKQIDISIYIPEYDYPKLPNRVWFCNVINTLLYEDFQEFILSKVRDRKKYVVLKKNLNVKCLPEFVSLVKGSETISTMKGKTHFHLKKAGTRKWGDVKKDDKEMLKEQINTNIKLGEEIEKLNDKIEFYKQKEKELIRENEQAYQLLGTERRQEEDDMT